MLLRYLHRPVFVLWWLGVSFLVFDLLFAIAVHLPGHQNNMCVPGGNIYLGNLIFFGIFAVLFSFLLVSVLYSYGDYGRLFQGSTFLSVFGGIMGVLSSFCTVCTLPLLGFLGGSSVLFLIAEYDLWLKIIAIVVLLGGMILLEKRLRDGCALHL